MLLIERGDEGLGEQIGEQDSLGYRLGVHVKAPVVVESLSATAFYYAEAFVSLPKSVRS